MVTIAPEWEGSMRGSRHLFLLVFSSLGVAFGDLGVGEKASTAFEVGGGAGGGGRSETADAAMYLTHTTKKSYKQH